MSKPDNYGFITPSKLLAETVKLTRDPMFPAYKKRLDDLEPKNVKKWFNPKWFTPTDEQVRDLANLLRDIATTKISKEKHRRAGLPVNEKWEEAVQVLLDEMEDVIRRTVKFEEEMGIPREAQWRSSSALAKLLLAAREVRLTHQPRPGFSINLGPIDEKNLTAVAIFNYVNNIAQDIGAKPMAADSRNNKIMSIVVAAMEACGWSVTPAGVAKTIRDHGTNLRARRRKKGGKTDV